MSTPNDPSMPPDESADSVIEQSLDFRDVIAEKNWQAPGDYFRNQPTQMRNAVTAVVAADEHFAEDLREIYFPDLVRTGHILEWRKVRRKYVELLQRKCLYTGKVVAADGTLARYETLSLVGAQIAITKVSYQGTTGQIVTNIMQWGTELPRKTTAADIAAAIRSRGKQLTDKLPNVFLYALMLYKERELLLNSAPGIFKLIHGPVFPYEMLSGAGRQHILLPCLQLIERLIDDGAYATIISKASPNDRATLALGRALRPGEYIVVNRGSDLLKEFGHQAHYTGTAIPQYGGRSQIQVFEAFRNKYGDKVVQGVLRAHRMSPPFLFYCNTDRVDEAVHMLMADAEHSPRGFPLLIDFADNLCGGLFKAGDYTHYLNAEFARASGGSGIYESERSTRD